MRVARPFAAAVAAAGVLMGAMLVGGGTPAAADGPAAGPPAGPVVLGNWAPYNAPFGATMGAGAQPFSATDGPRGENSALTHSSAGTTPSGGY